MSNGALNGEGQLNIYTGNPRVANDRLMDFETELYARVLGIKVPVFGADLEARTNPNGNARVFKANMGSYSIRIKLKWFGVRIHVGYNSLLYQEDGVNTLPYCVNAGGFVQGIRLVRSVADNNDVDVLGLFHYNHTITGNGCVTLDSHLGINGYASVNFDYSLCSDGTRFGFVPVQSALDYGTLGTLPLNLNLENDPALPIATKLANVAAGVDVMIGWPNSITRTNNNSNFEHTDFRNDLIRNLTGSTSTYHSCTMTGGDPNVQRAILNLEIGDEELYLENVTLPWTADYQAEYDIHVNERNPYYEYPSGLTPITREGIYSKENPFLIDISGQATFIYDQPGSPTGIGFNYSPPFSGTFQQRDEPLFVCCLNFLELPRGTNATPPPVFPLARKKSVESYLQLFPNPNNGKQLVLKYRFKEVGNIKIEFINLSGVTLFNRQIQLKDATLHTSTRLDLSALYLPASMYLIRLTNGTEIQTAKLIISK
jgi:hypothetical protein